MNLTPDQLGEKGESRFKELCADAQLICNRSDRDRTGWDFIVEGDFDAPMGVSLDHRRSPLACHIQVKTVSANTPAVRLKLNMAERLAKELKPSFICMIVVNGQLDVDCVYLLHMSEIRLEAVLKRLRKHSATSAPVDRLNKSSITFTPTSGERIDPTGSGLRQALQKACGVDMVAYAENKQKQLKRLGYKGAAYEVTISMPALGSKEMGDIFLGLKKQVDASNFEIFETRFGIRLPKDKSQSVKFTMTPRPISCQLIVRAPGSVPVTVGSEVLSVTGAMTGGSARIHLQSATFTADFYPESDVEVSEFQFYPNGTNTTLSQWQKGSQLLNILQADMATIELVTQKGKYKAQVQINSPKILDSPILRRLAAVINGIDVIERHAGLNLEDIKFSREELLDAADKVLMVSAMLESSQLAIELPATEALLKYVPCRPLVAGKHSF
ncbi:hypothetical protein LP415_03620 [Polaromonas sp. P1(28)-8]|nr:hypothetical protein LP415_03620 [Polaromonas sp. P1(28)-8]